MPDHDKLAERYANKLFPDSVQEPMSTREMEHRGIDPELYTRMQAHHEEFTRERGRPPTTDELTQMEIARQLREARRGL